MTKVCVIVMSYTFTLTEYLYIITGTKYVLGNPSALDSWIKNLTLEAGVFCHDCKSKEDVI